jgi:glycosyltransferase involved in cell wall biosynthesis
MDRDVISCVIPVYNGERFLAEALDSVLEQTRPPEEVIVVDDGSTDGTPEVAARYAGRVTCLRQDNAGHEVARNRGVASSRGDLIAFLDADDLWHPEKLAKQAARFEANPDLDVSTTLIRNFWMPELRDEELALRDHPLSRDLPGYMPSALAVRRTAFDRFGLFDGTLPHKALVAWLVRATRGGAALECVHEVLTFRRIHESNMSRTRRGEDAMELLHVAKALIDRRRSDARPA